MYKVPLTNVNVHAVVDDSWREDVMCQTWCLSSGGYPVATRRTGFKSPNYVFLHYLIMGCKPGYEIDHINGNKLDNREANLRHVTRQQQCLNTAQRCDNKSGQKGVYKHTTSPGWVAQISIGGEISHLGLFSTFQEAVAARKEAEKKYYGEYVRK